MTRRFLSAVIILMLSHMAAGQGYPGRPIRIIVPFPAGGGADLITRIVGQKLTEAWGQQIVVDNRAGAGTIIGAEMAAKSPADGYTLIMDTDVRPLRPRLPQSRVGIGSRHGQSLQVPA